MAAHPLRRAAVAGLFYPDDPNTLAAQIQTLLAHASPPGVGAGPKAMIVPHAGYIYSGAIAASAYAQLGPLREVIRRVILIGPSHHVSFEGVALPTSQSFSTPLGSVALDHEAIFALGRVPDVVFDDNAHAQEHSLEVQLPFLQTVLAHFTIVPLSLGRVGAIEIAKLLDLVWGGPETLILISSDLSHYNSYPVAQRDDRVCIDQILALSPSLTLQQACGACGINALLMAAHDHGLAPTLLDLRNSGDTAGDRASVVGYAAVSFTPEERLMH